MVAEVEPPIPKEPISDHFALVIFYTMLYGIPSGHLTLCYFLIFFTIKGTF
jgi:hypothetical protein